MNIDEVIILLITFILGSGVTYIGIIISDQRMRKKHFKSLYGEIILNHSFLDENEEALKEFGNDASSSFVDFKDLSYNSTLVSGEFYELSENIKLKIARAYSLIDDFNKERDKFRIWGGDLDEFFISLRDSLEELIKEIPKEIDFISSSKT